MVPTAKRSEFVQPRAPWSLSNLCSSIRRPESHRRIVPSEPQAASPCLSSSGLISKLPELRCAHVTGSVALTIPSLFTSRARNPHEKRAWKGRRQCYEHARNASPTVIVERSERLCTARSVQVGAKAKRASHPSSSSLVHGTLQLHDHSQRLALHHTPCRAHLVRQEVFCFRSQCATDRRNGDVVRWVRAASVRVLDSVIETHQSRASAYSRRPVQATEYRVSKCPVHCLVRLARIAPLWAKLCNYSQPEVRYPHVASHTVLALHYIDVADQM
ncbi:hypothetical protein BJ546DRAFT_92409 [Cryomyces antarcticus]